MLGDLRGSRGILGYLAVFWGIFWNLWRYWGILRDLGGSWGISAKKISRGGWSGPGMAKGRIELGSCEFFPNYPNSLGCSKLKPVMLLC